VDEAKPDLVPAVVRVRVDVEIQVISEIALLFAASARQMDPGITGAALLEQLEDLTTDRWVPLLDLLDADLLISHLPGATVISADYGVLGFEEPG